MEAVTYKLVLDSNGWLQSIELHQKGQYITLSFAVQGTHEDGYRWVEVKETLDRLQKKASKDVLDSLQNPVWNPLLDQPI